MSELVNSSSDSSCQLKKFNDALRLKEKECTSLQQAAKELQIQFNKDLQKMQQELHDSKVFTKVVSNFDDNFVILINKPNI